MNHYPQGRRSRPPPGSSEATRLQTTGLMPETEDALQRACAVSHKGIYVYADATLPAAARVRFAEADEPMHRISYRPDQSPFVDYLIAHEAGHIVRVFSAPQEERKVPTASVSDYGAALRRNARGLRRRLASGAPAAVIEAAAYELYLDAVSALTNGPPDARIERSLYRDYPGLRPLQQEALQGATAAAYDALLPKVEVAPRGLLRTAATLIYALAQEPSEVMVRDYAEPFREWADRRQARQLRTILADIGDQGHCGDTATTNEWARYLGIEDWFGWRPLCSDQSRG
jgi:hypothetical protein